MKTPLPFPPQKPSKEFSNRCDRINEILETLPDLELRSGREAAFASWLTPEARKAIRDKTDDPLSRSFNDGGRDMARFAQRAKSERIVEAILFNQTQPMSTTDFERYAGIAIDEDHQTVRKSQLITPPNSNGRSTEYADPEDIPKILNEIFHVWHNGIENESPVYAALWILVSTLIAHPFPDGNGRLARSLSNAYLIKVGMLRNGPVPFGPLVYAAGGNFEIAVRRVELDGNWDQLAKVILGMVLVFRGLLFDFEQDWQREALIQRHKNEM